MNHNIGWPIEIEKLEETWDTQDAKMIGISPNDHLLYYLAVKRDQNHPDPRHRRHLCLSRCHSLIASSFEEIKEIPSKDFYISPRYYFSYEAAFSLDHRQVAITNRQKITPRDIGIVFCIIDIISLEHKVFNLDLSPQPNLYQWGLALNHTVLGWIICSQLKKPTEGYLVSFQRLSIEKESITCEIVCSKETLLDDEKFGVAISADRVLFLEFNQNMVLLFYSLNHGKWTSCKPEEITEIEAIGCNNRDELFAFGKVKDQRTMFGVDIVKENDMFSYKLNVLPIPHGHLDSGLIAGMYMDSSKLIVQMTGCTVPDVPIMKTLYLKPPSLLDYSIIALQKLFGLKMDFEKESNDLTVWAGGIKEHQLRALMQYTGQRSLMYGSRTCV